MNIKGALVSLLLDSYILYFDLGFQHLLAWFLNHYFCFCSTAVRVILLKSKLIVSLLKTFQWHPTSLTIKSQVLAMPVRLTMIQPPVTSNMNPWDRGYKWPQSPCSHRGAPKDHEFSCPHGVKNLQVRENQTMGLLLFYWWLGERSWQRCLGLSLYYHWMLPPFVY